MIAEALAGRTPARDLGTIPNTEEAVLRWLRKQPDWRTLDIAYEAGPTGFGLARLCHQHGIACEIIAPGLVPVRPTDRVKTDRRDARKMAVDLRAGHLPNGGVPRSSDSGGRVDDVRRFCSGSRESPRVSFLCVKDLRV